MSKDKLAQRLTWASDASAATDDGALRAWRRGANVLIRVPYAEPNEDTVKIAEDIAAVGICSDEETAS
jgi:hypothetical protein